MDALSDYMLLEIFQYLDRKSLLKCSETCKRWFELTSNQISLYVGCRNRRQRKNFIKNFNEIKELTRRYRSITIEESITNHLYNHLKQQMVSTRKLYLFDVQIRQSKLKSLLENCTYIEELRLEEVYIKPNPNEVERIPMPSLNKLVVTGFKARNVLNFIGETSARELYIDISFSDDEDVQEFFQLQHFVEDLAVYTIDDVSVAYLATIPFKLKKLKLEYVTRCGTRRFEESSIELLMMHEQTLKELTLRLNKGDRIMQYITTNMKIETLTTNVWSSVDHKENFQNKYLQKLVIKGNLSYPRHQGRQLAQVYPNIHHLEVESYAPLEELLNEIASLSKLKSLRLQFPIIDNVLIRNDTLKSLYYDPLHCYCCNFVSVELNMENLEDLTIGRHGFSLEFVCRLPNLRCLSIFDKDFTISKPFLDEIGIHCPKLHTLKAMRNATNEKMARESTLRVCLYGVEFDGGKFSDDMIPLGVTVRFF